MAQTLYLDDVDFPVKPKIVYSTEKLIRAYTGNCMQIRNSINTLNHEVPFSANGSIDVATHITPFCANTTGNPSSDASTVNIWYDQMSTANATKVSFRAPRIKNKNVGTKPAVVFEGGSQTGQVFGLDIPYSLVTGTNLTGANYTVFAVMRPTSSAPRNQNNNPGFADQTIWSMEAKAPISVTGTTTAGTSTITVSSSTNIFPNMIIAGPGLPGGRLVLNKVGNVVSFFGLAEANDSGGTYRVSDVLSMGTMPGQNLTSGYSQDDTLNTHLTSHMPIEVAPSVVSWQMGNSTLGSQVTPVMDADHVRIGGVPGEISGTKIFQNENGISNTSISAKSSAPLYGFLGCVGHSADIATTDGLASGRSQAGDFWCAAFIVYDVALTEANRAFIAAALCDRFGIKPDHSDQGATSIFFLGDSIVAGYSSLGLDSMANIVQDNLPTTRVYNFAVSAIQVGSSVGTPDGAYINSLYTNTVKPLFSKLKGKKIVVLLGGGNDMLNEKLTMADNVTPYAFTSFATDASGLVTTTANHGLTVGQRILWLTNLPGNAQAGATYWVKTTPAGNTFTTSASPGGAVFTFSSNPAGTTMKSFVKDATTIYNDIKIIPNDVFTTDPSIKTFVCSILPRTGSVFNFILDDVNTSIKNATNATNNHYTIIDTFATFPNNDNPDGTIDTTNFTDGTHLNLNGATLCAGTIQTAISPFI